METRKRWGFFFFILFALYVLVNPMHIRGGMVKKEETKQEIKVETVKTKVDTVGDIEEFNIGPNMTSNAPPAGWSAKTMAEMILFSKATYPLASKLNVRFFSTAYPDVEITKDKIRVSGKTFKPYGCKTALNEIKQFVGTGSDVYTTETVVSRVFDDGSVIYASCLSSGTFNVESSMKRTK